MTTSSSALLVLVTGAKYSRQSCVKVQRGWLYIVAFSIPFRALGPVAVVEKDLSDMVRVLFLSSHLPYPPVSGGRRREFELLRRVGRKHSIHVCAVTNTYDEDCRNISALGQYCSTVDLFESTDVACLPARELNVHPYQVLRNISPQASAHIAFLLASQAFDIIHVEGFYMMQHVPPANCYPVLLVEQNIEYVLWQQRAQIAANNEERLFALRQSALTQESEIAAWRRASLRAVLTDEDRQLMKRLESEVAVRLVPDGIDIRCIESDRDPCLARSLATLHSPFLLFVGNFGYQPNVDAAEYLCHEIFPHIRMTLPQVSLILVGNQPPPSLVALGRIPNVVVTGRVLSVNPYLAAADIVVCPLRIGGGVKVKMLEALAYGKAIVCSSVAAQGLSDLVDRSFWIADSPQEFAKRVIQLFQQPEKKTQMEMAAKLAAFNLPTWDDAALCLESCYGELLGHTL